MKNKVIIYSIVLISSLFLQGLSAAVYTGSIKYENDVSFGFDADAANANQGWRKRSELSWTVSNDKEDAPEGYDWFYKYTLEVDGFAPVRWVIETDGDFKESSFVIDEVTMDGEVMEDATVNIGVWQEDDNEGRRDLPDSRYGMFWQDTGAGGASTKVTTISFWSYFEPGWGDLYANCGGHGNLGYNSGFISANPTGGPADGSLDEHVLVPTVIPEPRTLTAVLGFVFILLLSCRRFFVKIKAEV